MVDGPSVEGQESNGIVSVELCRGYGRELQADNSSIQSAACTFTKHKPIQQSHGGSTDEIEIQETIHSICCA